MTNRSNYFRKPFWAKQNEQINDAMAADQRPAALGEGGTVTDPEPPKTPEAASATPPRRIPQNTRAPNANPLPERAAEQPYFMTGDEAAAFLRVSRRTLERYRYEGTPALRYFKVGTGKRSGVRYLKSDLIAFMEQSSFHATSEYARTNPSPVVEKDRTVDQ